MRRWIIFIFLAVNILIAFYFWRHWKIMKEVKKIKESHQYLKSDVFIPTTEWQRINRDQAIPSGLHVRINLQTGVREAKLMSGESQKVESDDETSIVKLESISENDIVDYDTLKIDSLKDSLGKISDDVREKELKDDSVKKKFRTVEELKKEMSELKLSVKTDAEVMDELMQKFKKVQKATKLTDLQRENEVVLILKDLEYLLHQVDNAREFIKHNGISAVVAPCLSSNSTLSRTLAARVLGSAAQNNAKVQIAALKAGVITPLLRNIALEKGYDVRSSSLYALSCLIRGFPLAEIKLIEEGGLSVLLSLFDEDSVDALRLQLKIVTFFDDLLMERADAELTVEEEKLLQNVTDDIVIEEIKIMVEKLKQYNNVGLASKLVERGWCPKLVRIITNKVFKSNLESVIDDSSVNHDVADKISSAMLSISDHCESHFKSEEKLHSVLRSLFNYYKKLSKTDDDEDSFYANIFSTIDKLCTRLKIK